MLPHCNRLCSGLVLVLSWSLLGTCLGCHRQSVARTEIRIGVLVDRSSLGGDPTVHAAELAVAEVNGAGGLDVAGEAHPIVLVVVDTEGSQGKTVDMARLVIHQQDVVAVVGPSRSRDALLAGDVAEHAQVPMISPESTNPRTTAGKDYVFRAACTDTFQGRVLARFAVEELRASTAAVLYDVANAYNRDIATVFRDTLEAAGVQVAFEAYTTGDQDFSEQLVRIRNRRPRVLFLPNFNAEILVQTQQARRLGIDAVFLGSDSWSTNPLIPHPQLEGAFLSQNWHPDLAMTNAGARDFLAAYRRAYDQDPTDTAALTYDALGIFFQAIRSAGRADPEGIRRELSRLEDYRGVTGPITYRGTGGDPQKDVVILQIKQGKTVVYKRVRPDRTQTW